MVVDSCLFGMIFSSLPGDILSLLLSVCILSSYLFVVNVSMQKGIAVILKKFLVKETCFRCNITEGLLSGEVFRYSNLFNKDF